jgi:hypothetical protein
MARATTTTRWMGMALAASLTLITVGCSSGTSDPVAPGTSATLGGSDGSASTSTSAPSNSEEGIPANPGSVSEQRPPAGE